MSRTKVRFGQIALFPPPRRDDALDAGFAAKLKAA